MSWALLLAILFAATGVLLWVKAAPLFAHIQRQARAGGITILGDVDEANANAFARTATPEQGVRRLRFVAAACLVTGAALAWVGIGE